MELKTAHQDKSQNPNLAPYSQRSGEFGKGGRLRQGPLFSSKKQAFQPSPALLMSTYRSWWYASLSVWPTFSSQNTSSETHITVPLKMFLCWGVASYGVSILSLPLRSPDKPLATDLTGDGMPGKTSVWAGEITHGYVSVSSPGGYERTLYLLYVA